MRPTLPLLSLIALLSGCAATPQPGRYLLDPHTGSAGSETVEVALDLERHADNDWSAALVNGDERIPVPVVRRVTSGFTLEFPHYDSRLDLEFDLEFKEWAIEGTWTKERGKENPAVIAVTGKPIIDPDISRSAPIHVETQLNDRTTGRYAIDFSDSDPGVLELTVNRDGTATATVLTPTGDYRYLIGRLEPRIPRRDPESRYRPDPRPPAELYLSTFDGAHMFALTGELDERGIIRGFFYSGDWWVEAYTATPDPDAALPNAFQESSWNDTPLDTLVYTDLDGNPVSVADLIRQAHADNPDAGPDGFGPTLIKVFGSWCPNCHDAAAYMAELDAAYRARGLRIVGLAFELTDDQQRSATQVRRYLDRHDIDWPVLVAGVSDKSRASEAFPALDRVRAYPTTIFLNANAEPIAVHTGFSGPATGQAHQDLRHEYETLIETLLTN
ncbi:MAG: TlpA disulfide reductase family protein [Phycisphaerales bacterium JB040]